MELKIVGRPMGRIEGPEKVGGTTLYTADVQLPGMVWGKCLRSPLSHARIVRVNTEKAKKVNGVLAVFSRARICHRFASDSACKTSRS
ncbi:MAG: hypothetical protein E6J89_05535 [Deltaproteobacteria bacterium]|nr:MAG: hypothetical protein E6J89_05535 [Deltaproteobacteria bacterium]